MSFFNPTLHERRYVLACLSPNELRTVLWARTGWSMDFAKLSANGQMEALPMDDEEMADTIRAILRREYPSEEIG